MNRNEFFGVVLLVILTAGLSVTQTIYWFGPVKQVKHSQDWVQVESFEDYQVELIGTHEYVIVSNRVNIFNETYKVEKVDYVVADFDADAIVQPVLDTIGDNRSIYFYGPFRVTKPIVLTNHSNWIWEGGIFYGDVNPFFKVGSGCERVILRYITNIDYYPYGSSTWMDYELVEKTK